MRAARFTAVLILCVGVAASGLTERIDLAVLDLEFRLLRRWLPRDATREVVVVGIDERSTEAFPEPIALWHPHLSRFLGAMAQAEPAAVGIDVVLPERSYDAVAPGADMLLTKSLVVARRAYPLVLALTVGPDHKTRTIHRPFLAAAGQGGAGYALFPIDDDGVIRRFDERGIEPTFAGQLARRLGTEPGTGYIDFSRGAPFDYLKLHEVLEWPRERLQEVFRGRPVLLGVTLPFTDDQAAPVQLASWDTGSSRVPGVVLHAQALRTLLGDGPIKPVPKTVVVLAAAAAALLWFLPATVAGAAVVSAFAISLWLLAQGWFFPVAAFTAAALLPVGLDVLAKLAERRRLRASFKGYVSPAVMQEILVGHIRPDFAGVRRFVCVMFADIRGYTTRASQMRPEEVIRFLNRYFERVVALIHARGGTVVSIMGDGIMAVFGTPKLLDNPCREAFETAREMLGFVAELNARLAAEGQAPIDIGIGLNAGEALCGHVGSPDRHEYSAIGDVTNVASRLQSLTKEHGYRVLVSAAVAEFLQRSDLEPLGAVPVKGHSPVELFGYSEVQ
jgi:class 3 adenylate cyclase